MCNMEKRKRFISRRPICLVAAIISFIILIIFVDYLVCTNIIKKYQEITLDRFTLFGEEGKNLKDFLLKDDGSIISETDDPWIEYALDEPIYIKSIDIIVDWINLERKYAQVWLITEKDEWIDQGFYIHSGTNTIWLDDIGDVGRISKLRLDLFSQSGCSMVVNQVVVNGHKTLTMKYQWFFITVIIIALLIILLVRKMKIEGLSAFREFKEGVILTVALSFLWCVFSPLDLYFNNQSEFWFDIYILLPTVLVMFMVGILVGTGLLLMLFLFHRRIYHIGVILYLIFFICSYIQGNFLVNNLPRLDGSSFDWGEFSAERVKSLILWCVVIVAVTMLLKYLHLRKMYFVIKYVSGGITGMLIITLCIECYTTNGFQNKLDANITVKNQFEMSSEQNFIILVLDALDAEAFGDVMEYHPEYKEDFSDFTYFPDTMGAYPFTARSIPFILSGEWFENRTLFEKYNSNIYKNSSFFSTLEERNYKLGIYETTVPTTDSSIFRFDNIIESNTGLTSYVDFIKSELKLIGFRYAPFDFKRFCVLYSSEFDLLRKRDESISYEGFRDNNLQFFSNIQTQPISYTQKNTFKFIHIEGAHVPYRYDKDVNIILEGGTYEQNIEASMTIAATYLEKLKKADSYDNSVIIIMSDHGYDEEGTEEYGRQNPLLMIKGRNEHHDMQISQAPISYDYLQSAYMRLLDGAKGDEVFDWKEGDKRDRRFLFYWYLDEDHMTEYIQTGEASDLTTMVPTGVEFKR